MSLFRCTLSAALACTTLCGCADELAPGEWGQIRFLGQVRGPQPVAMLPPLSDRDGNAYVLYGSIDLLETELFVGHLGGGWTGGCEISFGNDFGVHGFVGRTQSNAWYWSGEAFVVSDGRTGGCSHILEFDPASGARLNFRAIVPWIRDTPSTTTALAWIQAPTDAVPFQVVMDLRTNRYTLVEEFEPSNAEDVTVLGVGGRLDVREGVVLVRFTSGGATRTEARFIDGAGETVERTALSGLDALPEYGILGYFQANASGLYAGLDREAQLVVFDRSGGSRRTVSGMTPVGVHKWEDRLFLVGTNADGRPVVAEIDDDGDVGDVEDWDAARDAADELKGSIDVIDDRSLPSAEQTWENPKAAMAEFPFLSPHSPEHYADGVTTWLVRGPSFTSGGGDEQVSVGYAPVGISYP